MADVGIVDGLYRDPPQREVAPVDRQLFQGAIRQRLQGRQEAEATQEARRRMNQEREKRRLERGELEEEQEQEVSRSGEEAASSIPSEYERVDAKRRKAKKMARKRKVREEVKMKQWGGSDNKGLGRREKGGL